MALPRLSVNWLKQNELFRRYWDQLCTKVEGLEPKTYIVSELPLSSFGDKAFVTDATTVVFNTVVVGGGTESSPVWFDGTDWRFG